MSKRGYTDYHERIPPGWRIAPVDRWPINNHDSGQTPNFDVGKWRFRTYGEVENPLDITYEEFRNLPHITKTLDHHCIDGWSYLGQVWNGVDISVIKEKTKVRKSACYILVESSQGLSQTFPIGQDLLLADGQNGSVLPRPAGYPLRIVAPGEFGMKSTKWVEKIKFCSEREVDALDRMVMQNGLYELYSEKLSDFNPWTVDNKERKKFLCKNFAAGVEAVRFKKKQEFLDSNDAISSETFALCKLGDLKENAGSKFVINGNEILVVKSGNLIYGVEPICPHLGSDLSRGRVNCDAKTVKCPLHGAVFDIASGTCLSGSYGCDGDTFPPIRTYRIKVESDTVFLERNQEWGTI